MINFRPIGYVTGLLTAVMGVLMLIPLLVDLSDGNDNWRAFLSSAVMCGVAGGTVALACANGRERGLTLRESFLLTSAVWGVLPVAGALPLMIGIPDLSPTNAAFESVSGMTTTGTTVIVGLDALPRGVNLWRVMLQWLGGLGIVIVAMIFLPVMKSGGMQFFRSEGFDTLGKVLPRAFDISRALIEIYLILTVACILMFMAVGLTGFQAVVHALSAVSTGGFSDSDNSFGQFLGAPEYVAAVFMLLASMPFIRYLQLSQGHALPLWRDPQVRAYLRWNGYAIAAVTAAEMLERGSAFWPTLREATFNITSTFSGTGFTSVNLAAWTGFSFVILIVVGLIGGCTSSTGCSIKVFRFLILFEAIKTQMRRIASPNAILMPRYDGRVVEDEVLSSVVAFFSLFMATFGLLAAMLSLTGLDTRTVITAAWTSIANVGPAFGADVGPTGAVDGFPDSAKWLMMVGMILGRLELLSVFVLLMPRFWRG